MTLLKDAYNVETVVSCMIDNAQHSKNKAESNSIEQAIRLTLRARAGGRQSPAALQTCPCFCEYRKLTRVHGKIHQEVLCTIINKVDTTYPSFPYS